MDGAAGISSPCDRSMMTKRSSIQKIWTGEAQFGNTLIRRLREIGCLELMSKTSRYLMNRVNLRSSSLVGLIEELQTSIYQASPPAPATEMVSSDVWESIAESRLGFPAVQ
jgi:hypothetical protein